MRGGNGYGTIHLLATMASKQMKLLPLHSPFPVHSLIHFIYTLSHSLTRSLSHARNYSHPNSESDSIGQEILSQPAQKKTVDGGIRVRGG